MTNATSTETTLHNNEDSTSVPEGYTLNFDSTEPVWFGPEFETSWAQWDFNGYKAFIVADNGNFAECMTLDRAKEVHHQLEGILTIMGELPVKVAA